MVEFEHSSKFQTYSTWRNCSDLLINYLWARDDFHPVSRSEILNEPLGA